MKRNHLLILSLLVIASFTLSACHLSFASVVTGSGNVTSESREISGVDAVELNGVGRLKIIQGGTESLEIEAEDNILEELTSDVSAGTLTLGYEEHFWRKSVIPTEEIIYTLTVINLTEVTINGAGDLKIDDLETTGLEITINGTGKIEIDNLTADNLTVQISGAASIELAGQVSDQTVNIDGTGSYHAGDLQSQSASVKIQGLGSARVWAVEVLSITINGSGSVNYYGSPELSQKINGLGEITRLGEK